MNSWLRILLQVVIVLAMPVVLIVMPIRVMMHPRWVYWEYNRPGFPPDLFGFTLEERTRLAIIGVESIIGPRGVIVLREARLPDGAPAFNEREITHMQDVRVVSSGIYTAQVLLFLAAIVAAAILISRPETRALVPSALLKGAVLTLILLVAMVIFIGVGFNTFFVLFHRVFFSGDSWLFNISDTLIRLYPVQFWFDVAIAIGLSTIVEAIVLGILAWRWGRAVR